MYVLLDRAEEGLVEQGRETEVGERLVVVKQMCLHLLLLAAMAINALTKPSLSTGWQHRS